MAATKLLLSLSLALILTHVRADISFGGENEADGSVASAFSTHKIEFYQLKSKIHSLESQVDEKTKALKEKNDIIAGKEKIIQEKSDSISSLLDEIASLQVEKLRKEVETQKKEKEALKAKANKAQKKFNELSSTIENLQKVNEEQKLKIHKIKRALNVAKKEMMKAKYEATAKIKELMEVHGAWLPPWLAVHLIQCQSSLETHWKFHGKPALELVSKKVLEQKFQAEKWAEPYLEKVKTKVIPSIKEQWLVIRLSVKPQLQSLSANIVEVYEILKSTLAPHVLEAQEIVDPYFQVAKKYSKPYIDQVASVAKPHVGKTLEVLKTYTKKTILAYSTCLQYAMTYHHQVQAIVKETLEKYELTKPFATKELEWFAASALLALPIIILFRTFSSILGKRTKKPVRNANSHHPRRKAKRGHSDKYATT